MKRSQEQDFATPDLPEEVWNIILLADGNIATIYSMRLISKSFWKLVEERTLGSITLLESPTISKTPPEIMSRCLGLKKIHYTGRCDDSWMRKLPALLLMTRLENLETGHNIDAGFFMPYITNNIKHLSFASYYGVYQGFTKFTRLESLRLVYTRLAPMNHYIKNLSLTLQSLNIECGQSYIPTNCLSYLTNLTSLSLKSLSPQNDDIGDALVQMTRLQNLSLSVLISNLNPSHLAPFSFNLTKFHLIIDEQMTSEVDSLLHGMTSLTDLSLNCQRKAFTGEELPKMPFLKRLVIMSGQLDNNHFRKLSTITFLILTNNESITNESMNSLTQLKELRLMNDCIMTNECYTGLTQLEELTLYLCKGFVHPNERISPPSLKNISFH